MWSLFSGCCLDLSTPMHAFYFCLGRAKQSPAKVADGMLEAIVEFASNRSVQHLKKIKIVIFQTHMLRDFYESMKKIENAHSPETDSWTSLITCK